MRISIVVPVYREEKNLPRFYERLEAVTSGIKAQWEYVFVNDGSPDNSIGVLKALAARDPRVKVLDFSKNFGKEIALTAGVHSCAGDAVICMDADLQHPPELIPKLVDAWTAGAEVVTTVRLSVGGHSSARRLFSWLYYKIMGWMSGLDMVAHTTDFRLFDKKVMDVFNRMTERQRMFRGIIDWMGFKTEYVEFHADSRESGVAAYSYGKLWDLALSSITSFSLVPLKMTSYLGVAITAISSILFAWMMLAKVGLVPGVFTPLAMVVVANTILIGVVLMSLGVIALYIGTIHTEVTNRPLYIVRERVNMTAPTRENSRRASDFPNSLVR
ncbi:MAG: glycosyltransferase family 2 protein [Elusimicrobiales bacterium]|jgi:dolichol-phosphate mannosyltransferase